MKVKVIGYVVKVKQNLGNIKTYTLDNGFKFDSVKPFIIGEIVEVRLKQEAMTK